MENNVSLVILIIVLVLLVVVLPVYNIFTRQDDMSYNLVLKTSTNLVDKVRTTGVFTYDDYTKLLEQISSTNNTYEIKFEGYQEYLLKQNDGTYKEVDIIDYTDTIMSAIKAGNYTGEYRLDKGERFYIRIRNTNITKADSILSSIKIIDSDSKIDIDYGGVVLVNTIKK